MFPSYLLGPAVYLYPHHCLPRPTAECSHRFVMCLCHCHYSLSDFADSQYRHHYYLSDPASIPYLFAGYLLGPAVYLYPYHCLSRLTAECSHRFVTCLCHCRYSLSDFASSQCHHRYCQSGPADIRCLFVSHSPALAEYLCRHHYSSRLTAKCSHRFVTCLCHCHYWLSDFANSQYRHRYYLSDPASIPYLFVSHLLGPAMYLYHHHYSSHLTAEYSRHFARYLYHCHYSLSGFANYQYQLVQPRLIPLHHSPK